jgi:radical SAM protein with 4Fe4S-binding SPASM domain
MAARSGVPLSVIFQVTDRCNYRCTHCYETHSRGEGELSTLEVIRILDELQAAGTLFLSFTGGEPFVRDDMPALLQAAVDRRFVTKIKSTGHFIDDACADRLARIGIAEVQLSVYAADPEIHDGVTRHAGSLERTLGAARRLRQRGIPVVMATPLMAANFDEYRAVRELSASIGAESTVDPKITAREDADKGPLSLRMTDAQVRELYDDERLNALDGYAAEVACGRPARPLPSLDDSPCGIGRRACHINPRGEVYGCTALALPVGDLRIQSFHDVWSGSPALQRLRAIRWRDIQGCNTCDVRRYCQRCNAMALTEDGELLGPSSEACRHAVALRESLRARGLVPDDDRAVPVGLRKEPTSVRRPASLRVIA